MLSDSGCPLTSISPQKLDSLIPTAATPPLLLSNFGSGSGGFAENVFIASAKELFGQKVSSPLDFRVVKNSDFQVRKIKLQCQQFIHLPWHDGSAVRVPNRIELKQEFRKMKSWVQIPGSVKKYPFKIYCLKLSFNNQFRIKMTGA